MAVAHSPLAHTPSWPQCGSQSGSDAGAAQAEVGDFPAAVAAAERAATVATAQGLEEIAAKNRELLQLYRQGRSFHEMKPDQ